MKICSTFIFELSYIFISLCAFYAYYHWKEINSTKMVLSVIKKQNTQFFKKDVNLWIVPVVFLGVWFFYYSPDRLHSHISSLNSMRSCTYTELHRPVYMSRLDRCVSRGLTPKVQSTRKPHTWVCSQGVMALHTRNDSFTSCLWASGKFEKGWQGKLSKIDWTSLGSLCNRADGAQTVTGQTWMTALWYRTE